MSGSLTRETWQRLERLLDAGLDVPLEEREAWLQEACSDADLRERLRALLAANDRQAGPLDESAEALARAFLDDEPPPDPSRTPSDAIVPLTEVPPWRIVREIGEGGMGRVYLAERADGQFDQQVALKVVRPGKDGEAIRERFLQERQILASLQHPNIAGLVDGGLTPDGRPFFAMEYVEGRPVTAFAEEHSLSVSERVDLFRRVCEAVAYAQQRLVVHRDLKPSNVLVTADRQVKLLDFGIAKILGDREEAPLTQVGSWLLTPEYAAPEQLRGDAVTTATDVYALGGVLHELLTGQRPRTASAGAARARPESPPATSDRSPLPVARDLTNIIAKARAEEPERRYPTAEALGEDLRRWREGLPVVARAPSAAYRLSKFIARHAVAVGGAVAVVIALIAGLVTTTWQAQRAERQAARAEAVRDFLIALFEEADPNAAQGEDPPVSEILQRGVARIDEELAGDPELQSEMLSVLGELQLKRGAYASAEELHLRALEVRGRNFGENHPLVVKSQLELGGVYYWQTRYALAESIFTVALATERGRRPADDAALARCVSNLASAKNALGNEDEAEPLYKEAIDLDRRHYGARHLEVAADLNNYAAYLGELGRYAEADSIYREVLEIRREGYGDSHTEIALTLHNRGHTLRMMGKQAEAEAMLGEAAAMRQKLYGGPHPRLAATLRELGSAVMAQGRHAEAESLFVASLEMTRVLVGEVHADVASCINDLAVVAFLKGDLRRSKERFAESLAIFEQLLPPDHPTVLTIRTNLGRVALESGDLDSAERVYAQALAQLRTRYGENHPRVAEMWIGTGSVRAARGRWPESMDAYGRAVNIYVEVHGEEHIDVAMARSFLARSLGEVGRYADAERLLRQSLARYEPDLPPTHGRVLDAKMRLGRVLTQVGRADEALPLLEEAEEGKRAAYGERDARTAVAMALHGTALHALHRDAEARPLLSQAI